MGRPPHERNKHKEATASTKSWSTLARKPRNGRTTPCQRGCVGLDRPQAGKQIDRCGTAERRHAGAHRQDVKVAKLLAGVPQRRHHTRREPASRRIWRTYEANHATSQLSHSKAPKKDDGGSMSLRASRPRRPTDRRAGLSQQAPAFSNAAAALTRLLSAADPGRSRTDRRTQSRKQPPRAPAFRFWLL
jgi:hypothetical protein